ncbi:MAG TPA: hypothetical protein VJ782_05775 [Aeromicrobium sp.]|nr:hypothetical protein [Aeromicrobium sp.]
MLAYLIRMSQLGGHGPAPAVVAAGVIAVIAVAGAHRAGVWAVLLGTFLVPMTTLGPSPTSLWTFADALLVLGFVLLVPQILGGRLHAPPMFVAGSVILIVAGLVASTFSGAPYQSLAEMMRVVAAAVMLPTAILLWNPSRRKIVAIAGAYTLGSAVSAAYGLVTGIKSVDGRYAGLTDHPNHLGLTSMFSVALVPFLLASSGRERRWLWISIGAVNAVGVWVSGSRAALLVLLVLLPVFPLVSRSAAGLGLLGFAAGIGLLFADRLLNVEGGNALSRLLGAGSTTGSNAEREERIDTILATIREHPLLGSGFVHSWFAHVTYLEVMAAAGLFGLIGFCAILLAADRTILTAPPPYNLLAYPAFGYTIVGFATNVLWDRYIWIPISLSLLAWTHSRPNPDRDHTDASSPQPMEAPR